VCSSDLVGFDVRREDDVNELRIGVIGAGHMGRLHAEKIAALRSAGARIRLGGIVDIDATRAKELGAKVDAPAFVDARELFDQVRPRGIPSPIVDAVVVAVPTISHFSVVERALQAGMDVLVEKPIAANLREAEQLLALAEAGGRVLQVGHLEWFNSALEGIRGRIHEPRFIEAHRVGPFPDRATDIDIVRDLMIHDLDILQQILGEPPERIEAVGIPVLTPNIDIANARLCFPGGCVANLTASRVSSTPQRRLRFYQRDGCVSIDFLAQAATVFRRHVTAAGQAHIVIDELEVGRTDALLSQMRDFVRAVRTRQPPKVDGAGGLDALRTALRVVDAMLPLHELA
jgi:predicted dehydrogenase